MAGDMDGHAAKINAKTDIINAAIDVFVAPMVQPPVIYFPDNLASIARAARS